MEYSAATLRSANASSVIAAIVINFLVGACSYERATVSNLKATPDNPGDLYSQDLSRFPVGGVLDEALGKVLKRPSIRKTIGSTTAIPSNYSSYSLFLICNPEWIRKLDSDSNAFNPLYRNYRAFGDSLGPKHLAVWFWEGTRGEKNLQKKYDVHRAVEYCYKYKLRPSRSPHVLVTTTYPDWESALEDYLIVELGNLNERGSLEMLSELADQILTENLDQEKLYGKNYWISWRTILNRVMISLGSLSEKVRISLDTKFIKISFGKSDESDKVQSAPSIKQTFVK